MVRRGGGGVSDEWEDRSAALLSLLLELPIMLCIPLPHRALYGLGFSAKSLTHLPTATRFNSHYLSFSYSYSSTVKCFRLLWRPDKFDKNPFWFDSVNNQSMTTGTLDRPTDKKHQQTVRWGFMRAVNTNPSLLLAGSCLNIFELHILNYIL